MLFFCFPFVGILASERKKQDRWVLIVTEWHSVYFGMPAGGEAFRVADRVLSQMEEKGEMKREWEEPWYPEMIEQAQA
jgi:hypothetical protein